jgi:hypothetical protein
MLGRIEEIYKTTDGKIFEYKIEAEEHQNELDYMRRKELIFLSQK